jgi:hypothetical protein
MLLFALQVWQDVAEVQVAHSAGQLKQLFCPSLYLPVPQLTLVTQLVGLQKSLSFGHLQAPDLTTCPVLASQLVQKPVKSAQVVQFSGQSVHLFCMLMY